MPSLLGAPLLLLPIVERALEHGMGEDSSAQCERDSDCTRAWADANGKSFNTHRAHSQKGSLP
jgi:hypothetical protein